MGGVVGDVEVDYLLPFVGGFFLRRRPRGTARGDGELRQHVDGILLGDGAVEVEDYEAGHGSLNSLGADVMAGDDLVSGFPEGHPRRKKGWVGIRVNAY